MEQSNHIWLGDQPLTRSTGEPDGHYVEIEGERFYRISHYDAMDDFFITLISATNHWLFISTSGGLTAGRANSESALFPYYTEDKIRDSADVTGHKAVFLVTEEVRTSYWEPFSRQYDGVYSLRRNLYKNVLGSTLIFEEVNDDLGLTYRYAWQTSHRYGFVKKSWLTNQGDAPLHINLLDGVQNLLPYGATPGTQNELSCLVDAYKKNELDLQTGLAVYTMSSLLTDKAEPSEALSATVAWSYGFDQPNYVLSSVQLDAFRHTGVIETEREMHGRRGAYFVNDRITLQASEQRAWGIVADVNQGPAGVANLRERLTRQTVTHADVDQDIALGNDRLAKIIGTADGFQVTSETLSTAHHTANVLFNVMRGGLFDDNYVISKRDFQSFCSTWNRGVTGALPALLETLPEEIDYLTLRDGIDAADDPLLARLFLEYLPLSFSRRHGDPSRPWNHFSIDVLTEDNQKRLAYAGNWRDIFQNWEALSASIPGFVEHIICKFVSASTADGYNPYRITREGIDWEKPEPENPWANIGYWGDHQIIYLLKLLESAEAHFPGSVLALLDRGVFAYANVPYRIKGFDALLSNPYDTISFDFALDAAIEEKVQEVGADGRLLWCDGNVYQVNLLEKLLVTVLSKLTNFVPGGGIWMNTQRPEWNDANNALVGTGVSMVTLCYVHRFLHALDGFLAQRVEESFPISEEVVALFEGLNDVFVQQAETLSCGAVSSEQRYAVVEQLGRAGERYRDTIYANGFSGRQVALSAAEVRAFIGSCLPAVAHSIRDNQREDGLFHAYNRIRMSQGSADIIVLDKMLEGQVAALSAKVLSAQECLEVLQALRESDLYTARQQSYLLYPEKTLTRFTDKNHLSDADLKRAPLLGRLLDAGDMQIVERDEKGGVHFNGAFTKVDDVDLALTKLEGTGLAMSELERDQVTHLFVELFEHHLFTGRSGGMYAYEGIGSIYWHMVSKLLLAVGEVVEDAVDANAATDTIDALKACYEDIRAGIGFNKPPAVYGAFPTDPYSHTPGFAGAKQPGMTGQVKEEVLTRLGEMGLSVSQGCLVFGGPLLRDPEWLPAAAQFDFIDISGASRSLMLNAGEMGFTFCQVPVVLRQGEQASVVVHDRDQGETRLDGNALPRDISHGIFMKRGAVTRLTVTVPR